ncbi:1-acyl-sn-glycerol-3-phosphate acyltransferase [Acholeplasma sp. OttesenSCG-928-E16]|nr:1-acyl-sn-glycerol-3-phosphate acyltransferase [Acholeplasma sp. OttesenSCG-928-E16]
MSIFITFFSWIAFTATLSVLVSNKWLIFLWVPLGYVFAIAIFLIYVSLSLIYFKKTPEKNTKLRLNFSRHAVWVANNLIFNVGVRALGTDKIPKEGPTICYCNHRSNLDAAILVQIFRRKASFSPKASLYKVWILRQWLDFTDGMIIYRDDDRATIKEMFKAIERIKGGDLMIMFPEGTTKNHESEMMSGARNGAYKMALKSGAVIVPVSMYGTHKLRKRSPFLRTKITVKFHDPIPYERFKDLKTFEIDEMVEKIINEGLIEIQSKYQKKNKKGKSA